MLGMRGGGFQQGDHKHHPHDPRHDSSFQVFFLHVKCVVRPGLTRKQHAVMIIIIAAGDARGT